MRMNAQGMLHYKDLPARREPKSSIRAIATRPEPAASCTLHRLRLKTEIAYERT